LVKQASKLPFSVSWPVVVGAAVVGTILVARAMPETTRVGRLAREGEAMARALPETLRRLRTKAVDRFVEAREEFLITRADSERSLRQELEEAKRRGSLPPA
jgi:hypothetical protein